MSNFFSDGSPYLAHPLLTPARTAAEVDFVVAQMALAPGSSILDVGCAFGRHSIELAKRGYQVVGIDPAEAMIRAARSSASAANVDVSFEVSAAESYISELRFDAAIALFTVLGQISEQDDNRGLLANVAKALKPGGKLLVEVPQREPYKAMLKPQDRFGDEQTYTQITRSYDDEGRVLIEQFEIGSLDGSREYELRFRLFDQEELTNLLTAAGFSELTWFADYQGTPLQSDGTFMMASSRTS